MTRYNFHLQIDIDDEFIESVTKRDKELYQKPMLFDEELANRIECLLENEDYVKQVIVSNMD